jgi:hypothetical protein
MRSMKSHKDYVQKKKDAEDYFNANKRSIFEAKMMPRWAPSKNQGDLLDEYPSDANYLF